ncbi:ABC transporter substrate-binding protein [Aminobacter aganoensis]|uniref:ABC-type glycerol-3-phosphate transport system substrate-binding protein n=1 Tax=Aminobacter aganoensis TaxID=83264 RepID=A0A7X0FDT9_9HYPH|nr:sugar ABC transporter substrate-binding protein [Aminobacter aganoensis]MBB6357875.1 ABC-type glycerol-3-phosphate transport system substrate-binding protein [Aminobacter aganoensis]
MTYAKQLKMPGTALVLCALLAPGAMAQDKVTLQWQATALSETQYEPIWKEMVAAFEAKNPNVKIQPVIVPRKDNWTKFVTAAQAQQAPCVASVPVPTAAFNGYLRPLNEMLDAEPAEYKSVWTENGLKALTFEDELYGLPFYAGIYGEIYNAGLVKKAGLDPNNLPETWADYLDWTKRLTGADQWGTAVLAGPTDTTMRVLLSWIYSNGGKAFNDELTEATFAKDPKSLEAIKFYIDLATKHKVTAPAPATLNYNEQTILFAQQKIATMRNAYWGIAKVLSDNPGLKDEIVVGAPPANAPDARTVATVTAMSISSSCAHPKEAWEFIKFMTEPQWAVKMVSASNWMPMRGDVAKDPAVASNQVVQKFLEMGSTALTIPLPTPAWEQIANKDVVAAVQMALEHPDQVEAIFKELDAQVTARLQEK